MCQLQSEETPARAPSFLVLQLVLNYVSKKCKNNQRLCCTTASSVRNALTVLKAPTNFTPIKIQSPPAATTGWPARPLSFRCCNAWNLLVSNWDASDHHFENFLSNHMLLLGLSGALYMSRLKDGSLICKQTKRFIIIREYYRQKSENV